MVYHGNKDIMSNINKRTSRMFIGVISKSGNLI